MKSNIEETRATSLPIWLHFDDHNFSSFVQRKALYDFKTGTQVYIIFWGDWLTTTWLSGGWYEAIQSTISFSEEHGDVRTVRLTKVPQHKIKRADGFWNPLVIVRSPDYRLVE